MFICVHLRFISLSRITGNALRGVATTAALFVFSAESILYTAAAISIWQKFFRLRKSA